MVRRYHLFDHALSIATLTDAFVHSFDWHYIAHYLLPFLCGKHAASVLPVSCCRLTAPFFADLSGPQVRVINLRSLFDLGSYPGQSCLLNSPQSLLHNMTVLHWGCHVVCAARVASILAVLLCIPYAVA